MIPNSASETPARRTVDIAYGRGRLPLRLDPAVADWTVVEPRPEPAVSDPRAAFFHAAANPVGGRTLADIGRSAGGSARVVIATSDGTRPVPNRLLVPLTVEALGVADGQVTILVGTGTHRPNTPAELLDMFGEEVVRRFRIVNHDSFDPASNVQVGTTAAGGPVQLNRLWVEAETRICLGFIEPHFFAGFSGGGKGVMPGVAGIDTILHFHRFDIIADPRSTYAETDGNPTAELVRECVAMCPPCFMVNVSLNPDKAVTAFFCGDWRQAHAAGCAHVKGHAMFPVEAEFPVVVTSCMGFPLDQNLYQAVKALAVAARVTLPGGTIVLVAECSDGLPSHGDFGKLMQSGGTTAEMLARLRDGGNPARLDQWQAQTMLNVLAKCRVAVKSALPADTARRCHMAPLDDLQSAVESALDGLPAARRRVAVLPDGPLTVPFVRGRQSVGTK